MKSFRTTFRFKECEKGINHSSNIITIGSCFSEVIGERLLHSKFNTLVNPYGTTFNPDSIFNLLVKTITGKPLDADLYLNRHDHFFHYQLHSSFSDTSIEALEKKIEETQSKVNAKLESATHIFITLGTAFVYRLLENGSSVANCHKQPQKYFSKSLLGLSEMLDGFNAFYQRILLINPKIQVVLTVSPVRHIKDGITQNQLSKSLLNVLCHQLVAAYPEIYYFPAYEIMMDDLRDYRFYKDDMIHPSTMAEEYIWEQFQTAFFNDETKELIQHVDQIQRNLNHRPFNPQSQAHYSFLLKLQELISLMPENLDFTLEKRSIKEQLMLFK
ncbi:GSCFA domain-containing protein [Cyclobacterium marinum]|uniref:GSCFA domain protein n=1 Tax=Cyclobacterium marinum (strain ATCC 25205 / DSM 745 / LMG 13164 / NCIMB 1802) TaxID=880070 RepID=G0IXU2_CYCMS|nr:GSCFA domain-containing protein [Cyclobacterium marinum]AEL28089.1 GSCFA domain protein [Cyclobacterium marinum DSM 745]MBI0397859.1 GSCFA domain-containing protein [Cyclobacterium marinum]MBR9777443.1 GSCFA domain-containing protein [Cytophagales bacterium]|tara:strand:- start:61570 stop:62556 length:987 start_codon:yes stop_codon:yes gene_type:complete